MGCIFCERDPSLAIAAIAFWSGLVLFSTYRSLRKFLTWYRSRRGFPQSSKQTGVVATHGSVGNVATTAGASQ